MVCFHLNEHRQKIFNWYYDYFIHISLHSKTLKWNFQKTIYNPINQTHTRDTHISLTIEKPFLYVWNWFCEHNVNVLCFENEVGRRRRKKWSVMHTNKCIYIHMNQNGMNLFPVSYCSSSNIHVKSESS